MSKNRRTPALLILATGLLFAGCADSPSQGRVQTDFDVESDVDEEEYEDGEEAPTMVEAAVGWEATRNVLPGEAPQECWIDLYTGPLPAAAGGGQRTVMNGATACGSLRLTVGYVDSITLRQRSVTTTQNVSGAWWQQTSQLDRPPADYVNYVQACIQSTGQCFPMYR